MEDKQNKIILDLCGGTGAWSKPYKAAGYTVHIITLGNGEDFYNVHSSGFTADTLYFTNQYGKRLEMKFSNIYGILAAPPCTMFSLARTRAIKPRDFNEGMETVTACLDIIWETRKKNKLAFWALENPMGYLRQFLGKAPFMYDPWEFGDPYTKKTEIWGYYNFPIKKFKSIDQVMTEEQKSKCSTNSRKLPSITDITGSKQSAKRAITPQGFAQAFFKENK